MNTSLAITISPPQRFKKGTLLRNPNRILYDEDIIQIKSILKYIRCSTYLIYPEFDKTGRLHYHGIINLDHNQRVRFFKYAQFKLKLIGFNLIKPIDTFIDKLKWILYITKDWGTTKQILEINYPCSKFVI